MARKLLTLTALISLVLLVQAAPGLGDTYTLPGVNVDLPYNLPDNPSTFYTGTDTWTEIHGIDEYFISRPGAANGNFSGSYYSQEGYTWGIGDITYPNAPLANKISLVNSVSATPVYSEDGSRFTVTIVYDQIASPGSIKFSVDIPGIPKISSTDFTLTATAQYSTEKEAGIHWKMWWETISGVGTNDLDNGAPFTITAILDQTQGDSNHYGTLSNFILDYPNAAQTPIPGAVWLLGTGLLGLGCVGWRRRT